MTHIPEGGQKFQKDFDAWNEAKKEMEVIQSDIGFNGF